jgi:hypothetical protein
MDELGQDLLITECQFLGNFKVQAILVKGSENFTSLLMWQSIEDK